MLEVAALQLSDPVIPFVLVKIDDASVHDVRRAALDSSILPLFDNAS